MITASGAARASATRSRRRRASLERVVGCPDDATTLVDVLRHRAARQGGMRAYTFLVDGDALEATITYAALDRSARAVAAALQAHAEPGDRALLMYPSGLAFVAAFLGCLYAGVVAVPIYPPRSSRHLDRLRVVVADADARLVLTDAVTQARIEHAMADDDALAACRVLATDALGKSAAARWHATPIAASDVALLQYTSGSTGTPRGVVVTHGNLMANERAIAAGVPPTPDFVIVSWLPMFHDMGLVGGTLYPLYNGIPGILMGPTQFLQDPMRWLRAISRYRGTGSPAPNFAFELCVEAATPADLASLDLSSWRVGWNGGEPVRAQTLARFDERFRRCGLRPAMHYPCYGLAESTLLVSGGMVDAPPTVVDVDAEALVRGRVALTSERGARRLVGCGRPIGARVAIVDPATRRGCAPDEVGEIWVAGPSVAAGYWRRAEETASTFHAYRADTGDGPYLRTGDLGVVAADGELLVTGRHKDVIIVRGRNLYPQDVERTLERVIPSGRANSCAVFGLELDGEEVVGAVVESGRAFARRLTAGDVGGAAVAAMEALTARMRDAVAQEFEVALHTVAFVAPGTFPRTSSGKVQRAACRAGLERGELAVLHLSRRDIAVRVAMPESMTPGAIEHDPVTAARIHDVVVRWMRQHLGRDVDHVPHDLPITALGIDSLAATALSLELERALHRHLPPTVLYDVRTIHALAEYVGARAVGRYARYRARNERAARLKAEGRYFYETTIGEQGDAWVVVDGRRMLMLGSYGYLGLLGHPDVEAAVKAAVERFGSGLHGTRLTAGTTTIHRALERHAAHVLRADDAIAFGTGFGANAATIAALVGPGDCVVGDEWNHASIVDGCRLSGATVLTYAHADLAALDARLREAGSRHTLVVVDAVFSMDGDVSDLPRIADRCRRHDALLMVDEAHSLGVLGARGHGIQEHFDLPADAIDVKMATLSKAIPSAGGVVAGAQELVDFLRHTARGYVFSGGLTALGAAAALAGLEVLDREPERVARLRRNVRRYRQGLRQLGFDSGQSSTPVVPILCRDESTAMEMTHLVRADGVYVVPIVYPAVPMNGARLRTCVMATHTDADIDLALDVLGRAGRRVGLVR